MVTTSINRYTPEEYLALERHAEFRSEYIDGYIIAMSPGAKRPHNLIISALSHQLEGHLMDGPCEVYSNTQRVKVSATTDYLYPDVVVSCDPQFEAGGNDSLLTPVLIIEVLSDSTERHDREKKFSLYKRIESLREYVLISQDEALVEQYVRQGEIWPRSPVAGLDSSLVLASVGLEIPLRRLYEKALRPTRKVPHALPESE
jgi:Uma2 family endonuclease